MGDIGTWLSFGGAALAGGAAFGGVKVALNGTRGRVKAIERTLAEHAKADEALAREVITRLTRIEAKLEAR